MNWWHRGEERYVEYGTSFGARALRDQPVAHGHDLQHEPRAPLARRETVFEKLDDAEIRTAGTTYLMYRGRHRHEPSVNTALSRLAHDRRSGCRPGARRSSSTPTCSRHARRRCRSQLGLPGVRDQHSGCVSEYLVEHDLFDFLLLSLPDNDTHSHKYGPFAQVDSIAAADRQIARMMEPAGGAERSSRTTRSSSAQTTRSRKVEGEIDLFRAFDGFGLRAAQRPDDGRRDRGLPELARRAGLRARPRKAAVADPADRADAAGARRRRPRDADGRPPGRRGDRARRALPRRQGAAVRPARRSRRRRAARAGASTATSTCSA